MKILILGAKGMLTPYVIKALEKDITLFHAKAVNETLNTFKSL